MARMAVRFAYSRLRLNQTLWAFITTDMSLPVLKCSAQILVCAFGFQWSLRIAVLPRSANGTDRNKVLLPFQRSLCFQQRNIYSSSSPAYAYTRSITCVSFPTKRRNLCFMLQFLSCLDTTIPAP